MGDMMYKVGDIVRVREDLERHKSYGYYYATTEMAKLAGRKVTIECVLDDAYRIKEMGLYWTDEMFEEYIKTAEIDNELRVDNDASSVDLSTKDLFDLYK